MDEIDFYRPFDKNDFYYERCFLCGINFKDSARSDEHIFPKWLQHRFNLWNESLVLANLSSIQYRFLTIPCCKVCNNIHLSRMEEKFRALLDRKFTGLSIDDEQVIFQWTAKILYGTLYKELSLLLDRKDHSLGNIFPPEVVASYSALHLFLQSIRIPTEFDEPRPWSIFIFNYLDEDFNYINDIDHLSFSIKLGTVGVVITFEDNGIVGNFLRELMVLETIPLNIMQFFEVSTMVFYAKRLALNAPFYSSAYHQDSQTMRVMTLGSIRGKDWNPEEYAASFEFTLRRAGFNLEFPVYQDGNVTTFLVDKNNLPYLKKNNQDVSKLTKASDPDKEKQ